MIIARTTAGLLGLFALFNQLAAIASGFDANLWWIDLRPLGMVGDALLAAGAVAMVAWSLRPSMARRRRHLTVGLTLALAAIALANAAVVAWLLIAGRITTACPVPMSLFVGAALLWLAMAMPGSKHETPRRSWPGRACVAMVVAGGLAFVFPLMQMGLFGKSDYRRPADAVIVLGAQVHADGRLSDALADRVNTACDLYHDGLAQWVIMSGGTGTSGVNEARAMRDYAIDRGVPAEAILLDAHGVNTAATVANCTAILETHHIRRAIVVSHFYHLPRIKLAFQRAGRQVFTVPAVERYTLTALPYYMAREVAAWWWYYVRDLA